MLFGNSHIKHSVGEFLRHVIQPRGAEHGRRDSDDLVVLLRFNDHGLCEHVGPAQRSARAHGLSGGGVDLADRVELVCFVVSRGLVAATFFGNDVNNHRLAVGLCLLQGSFEVAEVVPINRSHIFDVQVGIQRLIIGKARHKPANSPANAAIERLAGGAEETEECLGPASQNSIAASSAHRTQESGHPPNGGGVGATVVIDNND